MCALSSTEIRDCNLCDFKIYYTDILELSFTDQQKSIVNENTFTTLNWQSEKR